LQGIKVSQITLPDEVSTLHAPHDRFQTRLIVQTTKK
jgi:hypothetical protein